MPSPYGVTRDGRHDRLGQSTNLDLQIEYVEPTDTLARDVVVAHVPVVTPDLLIAPRAEGVGASARQDDGADGDVVARSFEGVGQFEQGLATQRVPSPDLVRTGQRLR